MMDHCTAECKVNFTEDGYILSSFDIRDLQDSVQGWVAELVFNLDEVGISDWEDRKTRKAIIPAVMVGQTIHHGVSRNVKHISVIGCMSAARESLLPYIVISQNSPTVQEQLKKQSVPVGRDMILQLNQKPYIHADIFLDYMRTVFLPYLDALRGLAVFAQEIVVLLMDNCSAHVSDGVIRILTDARVRVITFAPHTTQVFQVFDLILFNVLKRRPRYELPFDDGEATLKCTMQAFHDFRETMIQPNMWGAFPRHRSAAAADRGVRCGPNFPPYSESCKPAVAGGGAGSADNGRDGES
jgi:hypothetical protein